jgi:hypothetical protein
MPKRVIPKGHEGSEKYKKCPKEIGFFRAEGYFTYLGSFLP